MLQTANEAPLKMRWPYRVLWSLSALCLVCACGITYSILRTKKTVEAFKRDFVTLPLGKANFTSAEHLANVYQNAMKLADSSTKTQMDDCNPEFCDFTFMFDNGWLRRLHLAPPVWIRANVEVRHGVVTSKLISINRQQRFAIISASVSENMPVPGTDQKAFSIHYHRSGDIKYQVQIQITPDATLEQHKLAEGLDVSCLSKIGGCVDAQELLPTVIWPDTQ